MLTSASNILVLSSQNTNVMARLLTAPVASPASPRCIFCYRTCQYFLEPRPPMLTSVLQARKKNKGQLCGKLRRNNVRSNATGSGVSANLDASGMEAEEQSYKNLISRTKGPLCMWLPGVGRFILVEQERLQISRCPGLQFRLGSGSGSAPPTSGPNVPTFRGPAPTFTSQHHQPTPAKIPHSVGRYLVLDRQ